MNPETKKRIANVFAIVKTAFHWGFIPTVVYLGYKKGADPGMPPITALSKSVAITGQFQNKLRYTPKEPPCSLHEFFLYLKDYLPLYCGSSPDKMRR
ncbi:UNVERIFIED_CONTAM: Mitochondrial import receptor subunit TOM7-like protein [Trichonephila clavipes]